MDLKSNPRVWLRLYLMLVGVALFFVAAEVVYIDPFFHYHKPNTEEYFYPLNNERSQNDGMVRNFEYDALITGTSMVQNFKTTEMDALFGTVSIKVPYAGGSFKEIDGNLKVAIENNDNLKMIIRGLDMNHIIQEKDSMRFEMGEYPTYLYDNNIFNDVKYVFNRDVIFLRILPMIESNDAAGFVGGITKFDDYAYWGSAFTYGINEVCPDGVIEQGPGEPVHLTGDEITMVRDNVCQNITSLAKAHPEVTFYYFFTPYSILWWQSLLVNGTICRQIEAERIVIEEILQCENIKLFSFNNISSITADINNYKDQIHYGPWINSLMLQYMHDEEYLLTKENYEDYLRQELHYYTSYDYGVLNGQEDFENDYYAAALLSKAINSIEPFALDYEILKEAEYQNARLGLNENNIATINCAGGGEPVGNSVLPGDYIGCKVTIDDISDYKYLTFCGQKIKGQGQPVVYIFDNNSVKVAEMSVNYTEIDDAKHSYLIDVSALKGNVIVIFNGGCADSTGANNSEYEFSNIILY